MAKEKGGSSRTGGPHIKNGNLIGKGGGAVKKKDGSWVKGLREAAKKPTPAKPTKQKSIAKPTPKKTVASKASPQKKQAPPSGPGSPSPKIKSHIKTEPARTGGGTPSKTKNRPSKAAVQQSKSWAQKVRPKRAKPAKSPKGPGKGR